MIFLFPLFIIQPRRVALGWAFRLYAANIMGKGEGLGSSLYFHIRGKLCISAIRMFWYYKICARAHGERDIMGRP